MSKAYINDLIKQLQDYFVDKTDFVPKVLQTDYKRILICAPANCGKTTHLSILESFLQIPVTNNGLIVKRKHFEHFQTLQNYNLAMANDKEFFENNFGRSPVLKVDMDGLYGVKETLDDIIENFGFLLHGLCQEYHYLLWSTKLNNDDINQFKYYDNYELSQMLSKEQLIDGLKFLAKCLFKHFDKKKIYLLIDSFDFPIEYYNSSKYFFYVKRLYMELLDNVFQSEHVERVIIMGKSSDIIKLPQDFQIFSYSHSNHEFANYFGVTEMELNQIFDTHNVLDEAREEFKQRHKPYYVKNGLVLYSMKLVREICQFEGKVPPPEACLDCETLEI